ncbi:formylglycine-generating enzyme family protein [bacterium]|nr:formylglycine-generating enzyme family protein [bacterium]
MKKAILLAVVALLSLAAFCDECWSEAGSFDGSELTTIVLKPTDPISYSSALADGNPVSLTIEAVDESDETIVASIFSNATGTALEGTTTWNYNASEYSYLPKNDTYEITETVTSSRGSEAFSCTVTILPEPALFAIFAVLGALFLRKRVKALAAVLAVIAVSAFSARADGAVGSVSFLQIKPCSKNVIINYTMTPANADALYDMKFYGSVDNGATTFELREKGTLQGALYPSLNETFCGAGNHKVIWIPDDSFHSVKTDQFKVKVQAEAVDIGETYMVIDISGGTEAESFPISYLSAVPTDGWDDNYKTTKLLLRLIPAGTYIMGSPAGETGRGANEVEHKVTLTRPFYAGVFEVTQRQYELVMGINPSEYEGYTRPVEKVSYNDIRGSNKGGAWPADNAVDEDSFMGILRAKTGLAFDLPTEGQWEFACRGLTTTALNNGKNLTGTDACPNLGEVARYWNNGGKSSAHYAVGGYDPNPWGLYDMHGNVYEWCLDWYKEYLDSDSVTDPKGEISGNYRAIRGGSWNDNAQYCRSATRRYRSCTPSKSYNDLGFRVFLTK